MLAKCVSPNKVLHEVLITILFHDGIINENLISY